MNFYTNVYQYGDKLFVRSVEDGERIREEIYDFQPTLFVPEEKSKYKTIFNKPVGPIQPGGITACREFIKLYKDVPNFEIYGGDDWIHQYIYENFKSTEFDISKIRVCTIDIEVESENGFPDVESANEKINVITIKDSLTNRFYVFGLGDFYSNRSDVSYLKCESEQKLLEKFMEFFIELKPDIVTGWNCKWYDVPYLIRRMKTMFEDKFINKISPWGRIKESKRTNYKFSGAQAKEEIYYKIVGIAILDSLDMYKKFTYTNRESYSLDYIGKVEVGESKLDWHAMGYNSHKDVYKNDFQTWVEYNIQDVELVEKINDRLNLIDLIVQMSYDAGVNFEEVSSPVRMWEGIIYKHLRSKNIVIPMEKTEDQKREYEGGYVKKPITGFHDWVVSFDLNSLYPHLIMQYNISTETLSERPKLEYKIEDYLSQVELPNTEDSITANGYFYTKDKQGFFGELMEWMYDDRTKYKELEQKAKQRGDDHLVAKYNTIQMARKIALNSAYGALANEWFRYYDIRLAESITKSGQLAIRWIEQELNIHLNEVMETKDKDYVVASDTDSVYLALGDLVDKFLGSVTDKDRIVDMLDSFCEDRLQLFIDESFQKLADYMNAYQQRMVMDREVIADKAIWTAKKRYMLNVYDAEGYRHDEPDLKIMGIESQRSSTPSICRDKIKESLKIILQGTEEEIQEYISNFKDEFFEMSPEVVAFPRSVSGLQKYKCPNQIYQKGTPIQTKGSLLYNYWINEKNIDNTYETINEGDKIKFTYLKEPNVINAKVISFPSRLPEELGLKKYVDYETQFEKSYLEPIITVLDSIDWKHEKISTLEDFFGGV